MDFKNLGQSKTFRGALYGIGGIIFLLLVFHAGTFIGYRKAAFSYRWGDAYSRTFGERRERPMMGGFPSGEDFSNAHGALGAIIKLNLPTFILADRDGVEKVIRITDQTTIRRFRDTLKPTDLKPDDFVVVIGSPNDASEVEAKLIRLLPSPPGSSMGTTTQSH